MTQKRIKQVTDSSLISSDNSAFRQQSEPVLDHEFGTEYIKTIVSKLTEVLKEEGGLGIASTLIGNDKSIIVCVWGEEYKTFINPKINYTGSNMLQLSERCLTEKTIAMPVKRPNTIEVTYFNEDGIEQTSVYTGLTSSVIQHEYDHLNGIRFFDRTSKLKRKRLIKKLNKFERYDYVKLLEESLELYPNKLMRY